MLRQQSISRPASDTQFGMNKDPDGFGQSPGDAMQEAQQQGLLLFRTTGERSFLQADKFYSTTFTTLNGSGVTGEAIVAYDIQTNTITVAISAAGLEPNQVHIQHIHGFPDGTDARVPTSENDTDGDGFIELLEGLPSYGPILLDLAANHDNQAGTDNGHSHGDISGFPTAPDGTIWFVETYQLPAGMLPTDPMLDLREIVIHGLSTPETAGVGTDGEVNGTAGYKLVLPVVTGELSELASVAALRDFIEATNFDDDAAAAGARARGPRTDNDPAGSDGDGASAVFGFNPNFDAMADFQTIQANSWSSSSGDFIF